MSFMPWFSLRTMVRTSSYGSSGSNGNNRASYMAALCLGAYFVYKRSGWGGGGAEVYSSYEDSERGDGFKVEKRATGAAMSTAAVDTLVQ